MSKFWLLTTHLDEFYMTKCDEFCHRVYGVYGEVSRVFQINWGTNTYQEQKVQQRNGTASAGQQKYRRQPRYQEISGREIKKKTLTTSYRFCTSAR